MLINYLKITLRNILRHKGYSFINILGLSVGMTCTILILLWVQDELSYNRFHVHGDDLYRITVAMKDGVWHSSPWALITNLRRDYPEIEKASWFDRASVKTNYKERTFNEEIALVAPDFLEMFTFPFIKGNPQTALNDVHSVVLSERAASKYFGDEDPIGKAITLDGQLNVIVSGIIKNVPDNSDLQFDLLARPDIFVGTERMQSWSMDCPSYIMLSKGTNYSEVVDKISGSISKYDKRGVYQCSVGLQPLGKIHLYALNGTDPILYVYMFTAIAILILVIASINFMNLATARSAVRAKEIGIRKVVGANRGDVVQQFLAESIILSFIALAAAVVMVDLFLPAFNTLSEKQLDFDVLHNPSIGCGLVIVALVTGLLSGVYPSLYMSAFQPVTIVKGFMHKGGKSRLLGRALITIQFAAAIGLMVSAAVIVAQIQYIKSKDLGFTRDNVITISMDDELLSKYETLKHELLKSGDILNVSAACNSPLNIGNNESVSWEGMETGRSELINFVSVDYDYFKTFDMKISRGRSFSNKYSADGRNYIVNETTVRMIGYTNPIGKPFTVWKTKGVIVGVVKDFHGTSLRNEIRPTVFMLWAYDVLPKRNLFVKVSPKNIPATVTYVENQIHALSPSSIFEYRFMNDEFDRMYRRETHLKNLVESFALLAVFISCLGLLGLASFMAEQRTKEVGIRKALGASTSGITVMLSKEFVGLVLVANVIAWPIAYALMNRWLADYAYRVSIGAWIFPAVGGLTLLIALLTVSYQAIKAATTNPAESLKYE